LTGNFPVYHKIKYNFSDYVSDYAFISAANEEVSLETKGIVKNYPTCRERRNKLPFRISVD
jgi:hypothetical protein